MEQKYGIEETLDVLEFAFGFSEAVQKSLEDDQKISIKDAFNFAGPIFNLAPRAVVGIQKVPKELSELTPEEREEIVDYFEDRFDLKRDELEKVIEKALRAVFELVDLVKEFKQAI